MNAIYDYIAYNKYLELKETDDIMTLFEDFINLADAVESEYKSGRISSLVTLILYKVAYERQSVIYCDVWVLDYILDRKNSPLRPKSMPNLLSNVEEVELDRVCEQIISNIAMLNDKYSSENAELGKQEGGIKTFLNGKFRKSDPNESRRSKIETDLKQYEDKRRIEINDALERYETTERIKINNKLDKYRADEAEKINGQMEDFKERQRKKIKGELEEEIQSQLSEYANEQKEKIDRERDDIIKAMKENSFDVQRKEEEEEYNKAVKDMPAIRRDFNNKMSNQLRDVSKDFRESTSDISEDISKLVVKIAENLNQQVREATNTLNTQVSNAIQSLNVSANDIVKNLNVSTDSAVNSVVGIERALKTDDFDDLLQAYCKLDQQVYYRRMKYGEDTEEYKQYWKSVALYLKNFKRTLSKFGYEVFSPDIGSMPDDNVEIDETESEDFPETPSEYNDYIISNIISSGIRYNEKNEENEEPYIVIKPVVKIKKK